MFLINLHDDCGSCCAAAPFELDFPVIFLGEERTRGLRLCLEADALAWLGSPRSTGPTPTFPPVNHRHLTMSRQGMPARDDWIQLTADKATTERNARVLRDLVKQPDNKMCADCRKNGTSRELTAERADSRRPLGLLEPVS